jgi:hypothetical protein
MLWLAILMIVAFVAGVVIGGMRKGVRQDLVAAAWLAVPLLPLVFLFQASSENGVAGEVVEWVKLGLLIWWPPALIGAAIGLSFQRRASDCAPDGNETRGG